MNNLSTDQLIEDRERADASPFTRTTLVVTAWAATLLLSKLPLVIARDLLGADIPWIVPAWLGIAAMLFAASFAWQSLKPLRAYFLVLGVIYLWAVLDSLIRGTAVWQNWMTRQPELLAIFADRVLLLLNALLVIAALFWMGAKRGDVFLAVGDLNAHLGGQGPSSDRKPALSWSVLGPGMALFPGGSFFAFLVGQVPSSLSNVSAVIPWLPLILLSAAMNAFGEEVTFRAATLGTLLPAIPPVHALWMTSFWFGLGHYYGGFPSGPAGLVQSGLLALLMGKAMLDTRGLGWPWIIHVAIDTAIYCFIALTTLSAL
jgi:membrane protease YdiL (CAAX protease family)